MCIECGGEEQRRSQGENEREMARALLLVPFWGCGEATASLLVCGAGPCSLCVWCLASLFAYTPRSLCLAQRLSSDGSHSLFSLPLPSSSSSPRPCFLSPSFTLRSVPTDTPLYLHAHHANLLPPSRCSRSCSRVEGRLHGVHLGHHALELALEARVGVGLEEAVRVWGGVRGVYVCIGDVSS